MTPAIVLAETTGIEFQVAAYKHDPSCTAYGLEAAEKLGIAAEKIFKTLVVKLDARQLAVAIVPVTGNLNIKQMAKAMQAKKAVMADANEVQRSTGYVLGGVSPLGQKKPLSTVLDSSAENHDLIYVSAGKRGLEIALAPKDLLTLTSGFMAAIAQS
ncbi:MAG: Cys-tRNA(Pro) deacylase [Gammaproteobacteria bacterium]|jgi:Cys-tRNA(Pro)/Cys-tRNA(Cys) deacylase|nr:Cys-tRNA(Pro) deacylase [Gammaproteobacteria bacterium]